MKKPLTLFGLAGVGALALFATRCETSTEFPAYVPEICTDNIDNNGDGLIDCADPECAGNSACVLDLVITAPPATIAVDTLQLTGTVQNTSGPVTVAVRPSGLVDTPVMTGDSWSVVLRDLSARQAYTVTVIATGKQGQHDTASATFTRGN